MDETTRELIQFYAQKYHIPIHLAPSSWWFDKWDMDSILIGWSSDEATPFWDGLEGEQVSDHTIIGENFLIVLCEPTKEILEAYLPKLAIRYLKLHRSQFLSNMTVFADDFKRDKQRSIESNSYKQQTLSREMLELSRGMAVDRKLLEFWDKSKGQLVNQAVKMYRTLKMLVPGLYASIRFENSMLIGMTHKIAIEHDGGYYEFQPYEVKVDLFSGNVLIKSDDNDVNGYIHPHITTNGDVCWGNIGHLVSQLTGELDLPGLFQLIHKFITTYNPSDPYQRIEYWDPNWEDDDDSYCEICDESGHFTNECEYAYWCEYCDEYHSVEFICPKEAENEAA